MGVKKCESEFLEKSQSRKKKFKFHRIITKRQYYTVLKKTPLSLSAPKVSSVHALLLLILFLIFSALTVGDRSSDLRKKPHRQLEMGRRLNSPFLPDIDTN